MEKKSIVFLDFDGVINTRIYFYKDGVLRGDFYREDDMKVNNMDAIALLNHLCLTTDSDIVVTSSWRKSERDNCGFLTEKVLRNSGLNENIKVLGNTPILDTSVGDEIRLWLNENGYSLDHPFIIIDDGCDPKEFHDRYIKTKFEDGFTGEKYVIALDKLRELNNQNNYEKQKKLSL